MDGDAGRENKPSVCQQACAVWDGQSRRKGSGSPAGLAGPIAALIGPI